MRHFKINLILHTTLKQKIIFLLIMTTEGYYNFRSRKFSNSIIETVSRVDYKMNATQSMLAYHSSYIVFDYGGCLIKQMDKNWFSAPKVYIKPPRTHYIDITKKANTSYIIFILQPTTFYAVTGLPANKYTNRYVKLQNFVDANIIDNLHSCLAQLNDINNIASTFKKYLDGYYQKWNKKTYIDDILSNIRNKNGNISVQQIVGKPYSISTLNRYFKKYIGTTIGSYIRLVKFNAFISHLMEKETTLRDIADMYDFYDQAHLTRDFKKFAGITPKQYRGINYKFLHEAFKIK